MNSNNLKNKKVQRIIKCNKTQDVGIITSWPLITETIPFFLHITFRMEVTRSNSYSPNIYFQRPSHWVKWFIL